MHAATNTESTNWINGSEELYPWFALPHISEGGGEKEFRAESPLYWPSRSAQYNKLLRQKLEQQILLTDQLIDGASSEGNTEPLKANEEQPIISNTPNSTTSEASVKQMKKELEKQFLTEAVQASITLETEAKYTEYTQGSNANNPVKQPQADQTSPRSFSNWLKELDEVEQISCPGSLGAGKLKPDLINKFLEEASKPERPATFISIERPKTNFFSPEKMVEDSLRENVDFITETLANVYAKQGNLKKAIRAYEILLQKHPEKSTYFAALINELKKK
jgi:hypothetical protein